MFNVTDGRDRNFGVDFLSIFFHFFLKSLDSLLRLVTYIYMHNSYQTHGISKGKFSSGTEGALASKFNYDFE